MRTRAPWTSAPGSKRAARVENGCIQAEPGEVGWGCECGGSRRNEPRSFPSFPYLQ